jgi:hypothetical protein
VKTIIVNVPDKDKNLLTSLLKKLGLKSRLIRDNEKEEVALAKWIDEGMKTEEVNKKTIQSTLRKHGVKI